MPSAHLKIDTSISSTSTARPSRDRQNYSSSNASLTVSSARSRTTSNASSVSSLDIVSPNTSSSVNASAVSLHNPALASSSRPRPVQQKSASPSPVDPHGLYVLAMHDYSPQQQNSTGLSFRAGQVIHVLNRDPSGWWDGQLEGRRGWFPSNYVNADLNTQEEEEEVTQVPVRRNHGRSNSTMSWVSNRQHSRNASISDSLGADIDSYCPPIMVPLLHGLSLLQNAVRSNRVSHFQPSTACIISCVRSVLSATDTLLREAPILQQHPTLAQERRKILSVLALLVAQAKKASEEVLDENVQEIEVDGMLRLGGQVFARVRGFLAVAVQCGVELPERRQSGRSDTECPSPGTSEESFSGYQGNPAELGYTPRAQRSIRSSPLRARSMSDLRSRGLATKTSDAPVPNIPARFTMNSETRPLRRYKTHKTTSSSSSASSSESTGTPIRPPFPQGACTTHQVTEALRHTHDHYLSSIAAFIGHAHSYSRASHASSTGHMYDLVREIIEMVCKLLTIVEAVLFHPDIPEQKLGNLRAAKEGLYSVTSNLAESVRLLTLPPTTSDEQEKQALLRSATGALKAGADCVAAVKICLTRSMGERPFILHVPSVGEAPSVPETPLTPSKLVRTSMGRSISMGAIPRFDDIDEEGAAAVLEGLAVTSSGSESSSSISKASSTRSAETQLTSPDESRSLSPLIIASTMYEDSGLVSPTLTQDGTTWEGSLRTHAVDKELPSPPLHDDQIATEMADPVGWMLSHDYPLEDVAYNGEGHLVGATLAVLVEKMTPHDSIVDPAFSAVFFLTFRLFSSPIELVDTVIARYNLLPPRNLSSDALQLWQQRKGIPVRLRVSNFIKTWVETYWRQGFDDVAIPQLITFISEGIAVMFPGPAQRIQDLLEMRAQRTDTLINPKGDRARDPGMSINPPTAPMSPSEIPRPTMTKTLLAALRSKNFSSISIMDFDALELARQLTIMECNLYCAIQPVEILETGQEGAKLPVNVRAVSSLSTVITGWVAESILNEPDIKKRILLIKFFIKVADRCTSLNNYSTSRSMLAALDSSTISRLHQTWMGVPQKNKVQLESLRRLADHSRNYHEYRSRLRNTSPPAVPFLGLYLTDVTFCREGNPSHRASPLDQGKKLLNFNKYHKLARIVQDMQRFQVPYTLKAIPEVQEYLDILFQESRSHGDLQDLYRRSLLVEPKQPADNPPAGDMRQLFNWAMRSQPQTSS
ncbi:cell division control protein 25 [Mycena floridula]|nr:cell division control protein 25 [Mycena floridula]